MKGEEEALARLKNSSAAFTSRLARLIGSIMMQLPSGHIEQQDAAEKGSPPAGARNAVCKSPFLMMCVPWATTLVLRCGGPMRAIRHMKRDRGRSFNLARDDGARRVRPDSRSNGGTRRALLNAVLQCL
jgi:hypothetical protein